MIKLRYRSDIDGLRAVAVLGVVIYHAFPWVIPGGFIGVDIFFVISGYLISGILYKGHETGNFSFKEFYARRVRRLFPALISMLVITMAYGWLILLPDEFQQLGKHVAAGALFIQNIVFWQESGYFDTTATLKPLLHLWSLAVEEQFYIFFPPLLLLIWKRKWPLAATMGLILVSSLVGNIWMSVHAGTADFFLTPYRAWEFLGGSLLAWWHYDKGHEEDVPAYREAFSWGGAALLALGMAFIHTGDTYPGWRALLPVTGTLLLMEGGAGGLKGAWVNRKILSNPGVVWIGLISYPLYLFHWPALSFVHIVKGENPKPVYLADALIVALILTVLTYYFIERKVRYNKPKYKITTIVTVFILFGIFGSLCWIQKLRPISYSKELKLITRAISEKWDFGFSIPKDYQYVYTKEFGGTGNKTLFIGDSNMWQYYPRIFHLLKDKKDKERGAMFIVAQSTLPIEGFRSKNFNGYKELIPCLYKTLTAVPEIDRVVINACWVSYFFNQHPNERFNFYYNNESLENNSARNGAIVEISKLIVNIRKYGKKVTLVLNVPVGSNLNPKEISFQRGFRVTTINRLLISEQSFKQNYGDFLSLLKKVAEDAGASTIDPIDYLSTNGFCIISDQNGPIRIDGYHLRPSFVRDNIKYLDSLVEP